MFLLELITICWFPASFIIQFLMLSLLIGIPLFTLYLCLGQVLESGPVDMWRISPIFQGVGVSILITQAVIGMYSIIGLSWIFVYFRDSFISTGDKYKWALPHEYNFEGEFSNYTKYSVIYPNVRTQYVPANNTGNTSTRLEKVAKIAFFWSISFFI